MAFALRFSFINLLLEEGEVVEEKPVGMCSGSGRSSGAGTPLAGLTLVCVLPTKKAELSVAAASKKVTTSDLLIWPSG